MDADRAVGGTSLEQRRITATGEGWEATEWPSPEDQAFEQFKRYRAMVARSGVALVKKDGKGGAVVPCRLSSRYFREGRNSIKDKLYSRLPKERAVGVHLVLTVDPKREANRIEATTQIWKRWKTLRDWLNARRKRAGLATLRYCASVEFQKNGWPHMHIFIPGIKWLCRQEELQRAWGAIVFVKLAPSSVAGYVLKYVVKLEEENLHILWAAKARLYNASQDFYTRPWLPAGTYDFLGMVRSDRIASLVCMTAAGPSVRHIGFMGKDYWREEAVWDTLCHAAQGQAPGGQGELSKSN